MATIELYSFAACPYAQRTHITLLEKQLDFAIIEIDLFNRPAWFTTISPYGKVPVLRHAGVTVHESSIINQYLDEAFPQPALMPGSPALRAQARIWMDYCETRFLPAVHKLMSEADDADKRAANNEKLSEVLRHIEHEGLRRTGAGPWFFGLQFSLVDIQFAPFLERFDMYVRLAGATVPADCTRLHAWLAALQKRPSVHATAHDTNYHIEARRQMLARIAARAPA
ncbi:MAG: glutathione S-transferase family protein [Chromatiales bacterium]|nr:glutathione S-transferase family protein [Chromatiales bacterium]